MPLSDKISVFLNDQFSFFKQTGRNNKKKLFIYIIMVVFIVTVALVMSNNYNWYDETIVKITNVENSISQESEVNDSSKEAYYNQLMTGLILNGNLKGSVVTLSNQYTSSGVYDERYHVSDEVFVNVTEGKNALIGDIIGLKRDKYLIVPFAILLAAILLIIRKKGILTILSLFINILIFWYVLELYEQGSDLLVLSRYMMIVFTIPSLLLISGIRKKTFAAILSTLATVGMITFIIDLFMTYSNDVDLAYMDYIFSPNNLTEIFKSQLLIAGLGAIMDISIMMATLVNELVSKDPKIGYEELWKSGRELGYDVMGTMINVMLFTYLCGSIPMMILKMKLNISFTTLIFFHMPMELYRFMLGGIGIMIAVPISLVLSIILLKKWRP